VAKFEPSKGAEKRYALQLRRIARMVGQIVAMHNLTGKPDVVGLNRSLQSYAVSLTPFALQITNNLLQDVMRGNARAWQSQSKGLSRELRRVMSEENIGGVVKILQDRQVELIKSLPIEAGQRVQKLALESATGGIRADELAERIAETEGVTLSRANVIARTEISKANSAITQARSSLAGATHYIWRTASDGDVRESHAEMEGEIVAWNDPPTLSDGMTGHAGEFPNCRCFSEPIFDDE
jgi:SPP1 gp7 family putative phage head morphogenesis protein